MEFSRQECWSGLPFPSPGDLPNPGIKPGSPAMRADALPSEPPGNQLFLTLILRKSELDLDYVCDKPCRQSLVHRFGCSFHPLSWSFSLPRAWDPSAPRCVPCRQTQAGWRAGCAAVSACAPCFLTSRAPTSSPPPECLLLWSQSQSTYFMRSSSFDSSLFILWFTLPSLLFLWWIFPHLLT